jgi:hypothetical protein
VDVTEREDLFDILSSWAGPDGAALHWSHPRNMWGGLCAQELWDLGMRETVRRWVHDSTEAVLRGVADRVNRDDR